MATQDPAPSEQASFARVLGRWDVLAIGFGAMIGFGWVVQSGQWISDAGTGGATLAWIAGGVIMALVGLTYSELVAAMPYAGGEHNYALRALGSRWAFVCSWAITGGYVTLVAFEAVALPRSAAYIVPEINKVELWTVADAPVYLVWALVGAVAAFILVAFNIRGVKLASAAQTFAVVFLLAIGLLLVAGVIRGGSADNLDPVFDGGVDGFAAVLVVVPFFFIGFDVIPQSAEEIKLPPRHVGRLVVVSVLLATIWYAMISLTTGASLPGTELLGSELATADGMAAMWDSGFMGDVLVAGGIAGILTSWNAFLIGASRLMYAMGRCGMLPGWFGRLHPRFRTPSNALLFIGAISIVAPFFGDAMLSWLVDSGSPSIVVAYGIVAISFLVLRRREPGMERPLHVGGPGNGGLVIGALAVIASVGLFTLYLPGMPGELTFEPWLLFGAWWLLGLVYLMRLPSVGAGPDAEDRLIALRR